MTVLLPVILTGLCIGLTGCAHNPETAAVADLWFRTKSALIAGDLAALQDEAPYIADLPGETRDKVINEMKMAAQSRSKAKIRMINPRSAVITLTGESSLILPAERNTDGVWQLTDSIITRQTIDFMPAAE